MTRHLQGHHAIVTGGGRGIGAAIATELAKAGANLTLMGRTQAELHAHAEGIGTAHGVEVAVVGCDVSDEGQVFNAFRIARETFGPARVLVNNAGQADGAPFVSTRRELWDRMIAVNLTGTYLCMQQVLPAMIEAKYGRIINIASVSGLKAWANVSAYTASKHGVIGLTKVVALETAKLGITVNAVCPAYTDTALAAKAVAAVERAGKSHADAERAILRTIPRGSLITPEEVATTVGWLCSPEASGISGEAIVIAGGTGA
ncbi:MAG TPA: SDR family oxidoreductase [Gemmatimonadales bacterium]|jgi:NAD(P)-dependent dehydrogenase (short-subunit alcohol dehydrogenase family)